MVTDGIPQGRATMKQACMDQSSGNRCYGGDRLVHTRVPIRRSRCVHGCTVCGMSCGIMQIQHLDRLTSGISLPQQVEQLMSMQEHTHL